MASEPVNTANTLSLAFKPGQDIRFPSTSSDAIFTFGDYRIERSVEPDDLTGTSLNLSFTPEINLSEFGKQYNELINNQVLSFPSV